jgi:cysteine synthase
MVMSQNGIKQDILECIGNTPLVRLNRVGLGLHCTLVGKCEFLNPGGSVKDRPARQMLQKYRQANGPAHEHDGKLVAPSSGNMAIGLGLGCVVHGYPLHIMMPDKMSSEKVSVLRALGATVQLTPEECSHDDPRGYIALAYDLQQRGQAVVMDQYYDAANPECHHQTGQEILRDCPQVSAVVAGAGSGGTITGIATVMPACVKVIGVDPVGSVLADPEHLKPGPYAVEGIGYDFVPKNLDRTRVHAWERVTDRDAFGMARRLIREEGLLVGGSSGAAVAGALQAIARDPLLNQSGKYIVIILPDSIRNYLGKFVSDDWMLLKFGGEQLIRHHAADERLANMVKGPLRVVQRSPDLLEKVGEAPIFPIVVTSLLGDNSIVGLIHPINLLRARTSPDGSVGLEKNFAVVDFDSVSMDDIQRLAATGHSILLKKHNVYYALDIEMMMSSL